MMAVTQAESTDVAQPLPDFTWPTPRVAWYAVAVLFLAYGCSFIDRYILSLLIEPIKQDLGLSDTKISLLHGLAFAIFYTVMGIPLGRLADRYSRRTIIAAGVAAWSLMTAACGLAKNFNQLFLARIGVGVGEAALSPAAYSMIADLFPPHKLGRALSVYSAGAIVGGGLAFIVGGIVVQAVTATPAVVVPWWGEVRSWQLVFVIVGLPGLLIAALMFTVREPLRQVAEAQQSSAQQQVPLRQVLHYLAVNRQIYASIFCGFTMLALVFNALLAWTPTFLLRSYGLPVGSSGPMIGVLILLFGTTGMLAGGWLADTLLAKGYKDAAMRTGIIAGLGAAPFVLLALLLPSLSVALVFFAPLFFFVTSAFCAGVTALQHITPNRMRGVVSAMYLFFGNLIAIGLGPTAIALMTDYVFGDEAALRYSMAWVGTSCAIFGALLLWLGLKPFWQQVEAGATEPECP